jgi:flagellar hook-associated protein 1 FlgK
MAGLSKTEAQISVVSSNVTNADKSGYTVKNYQSDYVTINGVTIPISGTIVGSLDMDMYDSVIESYTEVGYYSTIAEYLETYSDSLGSTDGDNTLSSYMDELEAAVSELETSPSDSSVKVSVVSAAETVANKLNSLSRTVQDLRLDADQEIEECVDTINQLLEALDTLNEKIKTLEVNGSATADAEDERMAALEELSEYLDITYYINDNNQVKIYTGSGQTLLDTNVHELSHSSVTTVTSVTTFSGITTSNGIDLTSSIKSGKLAALIELRDEILVDEQEKLDAFADTLTQTVNAAFNEGTSYPVRSELTSDVDGLDSADSFSATGYVRIAVVDEDGVVQSYTDLDLSAYSTIGTLVTALDGLSDISASLNAEGELIITADNSGEGVSMNQLDSSVGADSESFSMYFGFSNIFTNSGAERITICEYLTDSPDSLASSVLDNDAALAIGDTGIVAGNGDVVTAVYEALTGDVSFSAAGGFSTMSTSLSTYSNKILSYVANASEDATTESETAEDLYDTLKATMENATGVNIDEETAKVVELESQYEASAVVLSTLQDLFDALIAAMN